MKITNVNDYVDKVCEKFPEVPRNEIKRIMVYGWKMILLFTCRGNDVQIKDHNLFFFIGKIPNNALKVFENYKKKLAKRIEFMFRRTNAKWDGYYYFTRTENQYKEYLAQSKKKKKIFKNVFLFKVLEEIKIKDGGKPYIFRLAEDKTDRLHKYYEELKTDKAELIEVRDPLKMKDILVTENKFKYIQQ